jgi:hypothetical protein
MPGASSDAASRHQAEPEVSAAQVAHGGHFGVLVPGALRLRAWHSKQSIFTASYSMAADAEVVRARESRCGSCVLAWQSIQPFRLCLVPRTPAHRVVALVLEQLMWLRRIF